jgi:Raf kinase inhibitor-like YbhB/YbcL family protein
MALIVDDPDAPGGTWVHWVLYSIPPQTTSLPEGVPQASSVAGIGLQGKNGSGHTGYNGPCPPKGNPHHYFFKLYALDNTLDLKAGATKAELEKAMQGHILAQGQFTGIYGR